MSLALLSQNIGGALAWCNCRVMNTKIQSAAAAHLSNTCSKAAQSREEQVLRKTAGPVHSLIWTPVDDQVVPELVLPASAMV